MGVGMDCKMSLEETGMGTTLHYGYATYGTEVYWLGMAFRMRLIDMLSTEPRYPLHRYPLVSFNFYCQIVFTITRHGSTVTKFSNMFVALLRVYDLYDY